MTFLSEQKNFDGRVKAQQSAELTFKVANPGPIALRSAARLSLFPIPIPLAVAAQRLELFKPGSTSPVLTQTSSNGPIQATFTVPASDPGLGGTWTARMTNIANLDERVHMVADFPGTLPVQVTELDAKGLENLVNIVADQVEIHLTRGDNASSVTFPLGLAIPEKKFTIPDVKVGPLTEFVNDINSDSITIHFLDATPQAPIGRLQLRVDFESSGREIKGGLDVEMNNMSLVVTLGLVVFGCNLCYNTVDVDFSADLNVIGLPDNLLNGLTDFRNTVKKRIEGAVSDVLTDFVSFQKVCGALSGAVQKMIGGAGSFLVAFEVKAGKVKATYCRFQ